MLNVADLDGAPRSGKKALKQLKGLSTGVRITSPHKAS
jgi:hypothetical protein